jgi:hypothetical protein
MRDKGEPLVPFQRRCNLYTSLESFLHLFIEIWRPNRVPVPGSSYRKMDKRPTPTVCRSVKMMVLRVHREKPLLLMGAGEC